MLRGLHYQEHRPQGKLLRMVRCAVSDVTVDIRPASSTFGKWAGLELDESDHGQLWIPPGFEHGYLVLHDSADVLYKTIEYYLPTNKFAYHGTILALAFSGCYERPPFFRPEIVDAEGSRSQPDSLPLKTVKRLIKWAQGRFVVLPQGLGVGLIRSDFFITTKEARSISTTPARPNPFRNVNILVQWLNEMNCPPED